MYASRLIAAGFQRSSAAAPSVLSGRHVARLAGLGVLATHSQRVADEVDVTPAQRQQLASTKAGVDREQDRNGVK